MMADAYLGTTSADELDQHFDIDNFTWSTAFDDDLNVSQDTVDPYWGSMTLSSSSSLDAAGVCNITNSQFRGPSSSNKPEIPHGFPQVSSPNQPGSVLEPYATHSAQAVLPWAGIIQEPSLYHNGPVEDDLAGFGTNEHLLEPNIIPTTNREPRAYASAEICTGDLPGYGVFDDQYPVDNELLSTPFTWHPLETTPSWRAESQDFSGIDPASEASGQSLQLEPKSLSRAPAQLHAKAKKSSSKRKRKPKDVGTSEVEREPFAFRFCFHQSSDPNLPTRPEYPKYTDSDLTKKRDLMKQGGACIRCRIEHRICDGGNPCKGCLEFWNANQTSRTIIWNECLRSKLCDVSPFEQRKDHATVWSRLITTSFFYDTMQKQRSVSVFHDQVWPSINKCPAGGGAQAGQHVRNAAKEGHCTFTAKSHGLDFYYAILALLVDYGGCPYSFKAIVNTAGARALQALDHLMNLREFEKKEANEKCGLLICLFYGLIAFQRLKHRYERSRSTRIHLWEEYKDLNIDLARLNAAQRILAHFFVVVCERLDVAGEEWYGQKGKKIGTHGFQYVMGMCKFVSTFEYETDLREIKKLLKGLPVIVEREL